MHVECNKMGKLWNDTTLWLDRGHCDPDSSHLAPKNPHQAIYNHDTQHPGTQSSHADAQLEPAVVGTETGKAGNVSVVPVLM